MDIVIENTKANLLNALQLIFIKWWKVGTGLLATWFTALFGDNVLLFITPSGAKEWVALVSTVIVSMLTIVYFQRKKRVEIRHMNELHEQKMFEEEMEDCRKLWMSMMEAKRIPDTMTIIDFKKEHYDKIKQAFMPQKHA